MLEGEHRTTNQRLTELVTKIAGTIRCLDENLLRRLIQPLSDGQHLFPRTDISLLVRLRPLRIAVWLTGSDTISWIAGHIHSRTSNWPRADTTTHTVTDFTTCTCCSTIEWLHRRREVMCLSLQRDDRLDVLHLKVVAGRMVGRSELLHHRTLAERHIVLVC